MSHNTAADLPLDTYGIVNGAGRFVAMDRGSPVPVIADDTAPDLESAVRAALDYLTDDEEDEVVVVRVRCVAPDYEPVVTARLLTLTPHAEWDTGR